MGAGKEFQHRTSDDTERAFRAEEKLLQIIAGVVFAQPRKPVPGVTIRKNHFEPQHKIAGISVAQNLRAACIGGKNATDLTGAFRGKAERENPVG